MIHNNNEFAQDILSNWKDNENIWVKRSACVSFVCLVSKTNQYNDIVLDICKTCLKDKERFVQLGIGWVLRNISVNNKNLIINFIKANYNSFIREGLRYSIEKFNTQTRKELMLYNPKNSNTNNYEKIGGKKRKNKISNILCENATKKRKLE